ncbi:MAG: hypothetical protein P1V35_06580 [Planctomycetota bacterium]|nr:hypothetical protein [Planctomycetota bacterium]
MKLGAPEESTSFYEVFSDLIFATMAIFVLLMLVFIVQMNVATATSASKESEAASLAEQLDELKSAQDEMLEEQVLRAEKAEELAEKAENEADKAREEAREAKESKTKAEREASDAKDAQKEAEDELGSLRPKPIDLVFAIDGSSSMADALNSVQTSVEQACEVACRISPKFRLGVVVYRSKSDRFTNVFPLTPIGRRTKDGPHKGMSELKKWMSEKSIRVSVAKPGAGERGGEVTGQTYVSPMSALMTVVDVENGLKKALGLFGSEKSSDTRKVLILMGDVGPWELGSDTRSDEAVDKRSRASALSMVEAFASESPNRRVMSIYTGTGNPWHKAETIAFFEQLAKRAGEKGVYSNKLSALVMTVVNAIADTNEE